VEITLGHGHYLVNVIRRTGDGMVGLLLRFSGREYQVGQRVPFSGVRAIDDDDTIIWCSSLEAADVLLREVAELRKELERGEP